MTGRLCVIIALCFAVAGCSDDAANPDPLCGDGEIGADEVCDDGNTDDGDGCSADCQSDESCGNGYIDDAVGEECDDGNTVDGDGCSSTCTLPGCGNGYIDNSEECDDGDDNSDTDPDACRTDCMLSACGDEVLDSGEDCDDGADTGVSPSECAEGCVSNECGDGYVGGAEECDDANTDDTDSCLTACLLPGCGDDFVEAGVEVCDDGNTVDGDGCSADCLSDETCGNAILDTAANEECDDGNLVGGDGCAGDCVLEVCGDGTVDGSEICDDGNTVASDGCSADCLSDETCGNGTTDASEICDDGNTDDCDGCRGDCTGVETGCGDGYVCAAEECDDGNTTVGDGCDALCMSECDVADWTLTGDWGTYTEAPPSSQNAPVPFSEIVFGTDGNQTPPYPTSHTENSDAISPAFVVTNEITFESWNVDEGTGVDGKTILMSLDGGATWPITLVDCQAPVNTQAFCTQVTSRLATDWDSIVLDTSTWVGQTAMLRFTYDTLDACCGFEQGWFIRNLNVACW